MDKLEKNQLFLVSFGNDDNMKECKNYQCWYTREVGWDAKWRKTYLYLYLLSNRLGGASNQLRALNSCSFTLILIVAFYLQYPKYSFVRQKLFNFEIFQSIGAWVLLIG